MTRYGQGRRRELPDEGEKYYRMYLEDEKRPRALLEKSAALGCKRGMLVLAQRMYAEDKHTNELLIRVAGLMETAEKDPELKPDNRMLADIYLQLNRREDCATRMLAAAVGGDVEAMALVGGFFAWGYGLPVDFDSAVYWLSRAIENSVPAAFTTFARLHMYGLGVEQNPRRALQLLERATELNDPEACRLLTDAYLNGSRALELKPGGKEAADHAQKGMELGDPYCRVQYALCVGEGIGREQDTDAAIEQLRGYEAEGLEGAAEALGRLLDFKDAQDKARFREELGPGDGQSAGAPEDGGDLSPLDELHGGRVRDRFEKAREAGDRDTVLLCARSGCVEACAYMYDALLGKGPLYVAMLSDIELADALNFAFTLVNSLGAEHRPKLELTLREVIRRLENCVKSGDFNRCVRLSERCHRVRDPEVFFHEATAYMHLQSHEKSLAAFEAVLSCPNIDEPGYEDIRFMTKGAMPSVKMVVDFDRRIKERSKKGKKD